MPEVPIPEAMQRLGVSEKTVRNRIRAGSLTAKKERGRWMIEVPERAPAIHEAPTMPTVLPRPTAFGEIAYADPLNRYMGGVASYNPSWLVTRKSLQIFKDIRRDDQIKAALQFKKHAVLASGWEVISPEGKAEDWEPTRFIAEELETMPGTFDDAMLGMLSALDFGYSVSEKVFCQVPDGEWKGKIGIKAIKSREPTSIQFDVDEFGNILPDGVIQQFRRDQVAKRMPRWKFILWVHQAEFGNPYGTSDLESAYRSYWVKDNSYKWLAMLLEKYGIPPVFGMYDPGKYTPGQLDDIKTVFASLQASSSALIPRAPSDTGQPTFELWAPELAGQVGQVFIPAFELLDRHLARSVLMPGLLSLTSDEGGSLARARIAFDVFTLVVEYIQRSIKETINEELVRPITDLNFSVDEYPEFRFLALSEDDRVELLKAWGELAGLGVVVSTPEDERHIRARLKFPERDSDEEEIMPINQKPEPEPEPDEPDQDEEDEDEQEDADEEEQAEMVARDQAGAKAAKGEVGYVRRSASSDVCRDCTMFQRPGRCAAVAGKISPDGYCEMFERRAMMFAERRAFTDAEKQADMARVERDADEIEARTKRVLIRAFRELTARMIRAVPQDLTAASVARTKVRMPGEIVAAFEAMLGDAFTAGRRQIRDQMRGARQMDEVGFAPKKAMEYLASTARFWVKSTGDELTRNVQQHLLSALKFGWHHRETITRLQDLMAPFTGDPTQLGDPAQASAARVETIVRTNTTNALNHGRLIEARRIGPDLVPAMQFSAVLDKRTTEVCRGLDGKIIPVGSPDLDRMQPPLHHNCRSILVPVTLDIEIDQASRITPVDVGRAIEQSGKGFA
jgi:SPP1 gp7 family putative phage head morphogenesis protein